MYKGWIAGPAIDEAFLRELGVELGDQLFRTQADGSTIWEACTVSDEVMKKLVPHWSRFVWGLDEYPPPDVVTFKEACRARLFAAGWKETTPIPYGSNGKSTTLWEPSGYAEPSPRRTFRQAVCEQVQQDFWASLPSDEKDVE